MAGNDPVVLYPELLRDPRTDKQRQAALAHVGEQAARLTSADEAEQVRKIQDRRAGTGLQQFVSVNEDGTGPLVARRSFLVPAGDVPDDRDDELRELGLRRAANRELTSRVVLESDGARDDDGRTTEQIRRELVAKGIDAKFNYIVPLGGVIVKAKGGPEPTGTPGDHVAPAGIAGVLPIVAIIDTGISREQRTDGWLQGLVNAAEDNIDELDVLPPPRDGFLDAAAGHGTFVAGVVQQVAPAAVIKMYRAFDTDGITTDPDVADLMKRAADDGADIINLSLGTRTQDGEPLPEILAAVETISQDHAHVVIVVAAGNGADDVPMWPAALAPGGPRQTFDNVVAVAGLDRDGVSAKESDWSTHGPWVTFSAVGKGVSSTYVIGIEDGILVEDDDPDCYGRNSWATWTGTSFAAPQVSGLIARRCYEQGIKADVALAALLVEVAPDPAANGWGRKLILLPGT